MVIHGFAFWKVAKPVDEHHLQIAITLRKPRLLYKLKLLTKATIYNRSV